MDTRPRFGTKIRALRRRENLTQAQLASRLEISASYLNLIEHDKRPLPSPLLVKIAQLFQVDLGAFAGDADPALEAHLGEVFSDPIFDGHNLVGQDVRDLVHNNPLASRAVVALYEAYRGARARAEGLQDQLSADDDPDRAVDPARLSSEEVSDLIQRRANCFPELEEAAEDLWLDARLEPGDVGPGLIRFLERDLGVRVRVTPVGEDGGATRRFDPESRELSLSELLPPRTRNFQLAHQIALLRNEEVLERLSRDERLTTDESRALCRVAMANYFAAAVLMPYDRLLEAARQVRYDVELLGHRFRTSFEQVCHRLTSLRRPGREGVPFHLVRVDIAGNLSKRFSGSGIQYPRFSGLCPRWNVFAAFMTPGLIRAQVSTMVDGTGYFCFSRTIRRESRGYHGPVAMYALGLGCKLEYARELVYSDGIDVENLAVAIPIGTTCRTCERMDCEQRAFPRLNHPLKIDPNARGVSFFAPVPPRSPGT